MEPTTMSGTLSLRFRFRTKVSISWPSNLFRRDAFFYEVDIALSLRNKVTSSFVAMCHFVQSDAYCSARRCLGFLARVACCACAQCLFQRKPFLFSN